MTPEERETIQRLVQIVMVMLDDQSDGTQAKTILFESAGKAGLLGWDLLDDSHSILNT